METIKVKKLTFDDADTFRALNRFISYDNGELVIHDSELYKVFCEIPKLTGRINSLEVENQQLKDRQSKLDFSDVKTTALKNKLADQDKSLTEFKDQITGYDEKIQDLNERIKDLQSENKELKQLESENLQNTRKIEELEERISNLKDRKQELKATNGSLKQQYLDMKQQFDTAIKERGDMKQQLVNSVHLIGYGRLIKEALILRSFIDTPVRRQFQLENEFKHAMSSFSVRRHVSHLHEIGLLHKPINGTYEITEEYFDKQDLMMSIIKKIMKADFEFFINTLLEDYERDY